MDEIKRKLELSRQIVGQRKDFLLDNIDNYVNAIYDVNGSAWRNDMLVRYIAQFPETVLDERSSGTRLHRWSVVTLREQLEKWMDAQGCAVVKAGHAIEAGYVLEAAGVISDEDSLAVMPDDASAGTMATAPSSHDLKSLSEDVAEKLDMVDTRIENLTNSSVGGSAMREEADEILKVIDAQIATLQARHDQLRRERDEVHAHALALWIESVYHAYRHQ
ncbi:uncharacterized protein ARMOST_15920 [Armillaria ostoyae]|uniref:Uncharacterized protein n=1 Tax=Armillaria ostoyae TaxID=47428 RepID=A0A284RUR7_ARMOS|nr:uncharacterized protein ARMOST_15920 [Armillaria ostoyae]